MKTPILDSLITMMEEVVQSNLPLHMENIFQDRDAAQTAFEADLVNIHTCGTACCIVGYAAFDNNVILAANISKEPSPGLVATDVWQKLEIELGENFADSVVASNVEVRMRNAVRALNERDMPTDWLEKYPHLSASNNTDEPQHALDYMKELRERLGEHGTVL